MISQTLLTATISRCKIELVSMVNDTVEILTYNRNGCVVSVRIYKDIVRAMIKYNQLTDGATKKLPTRREIENYMDVCRNNGSSEVLLVELSANFFHCTKGEIANQLN